MSQNMTKCIPLCVAVFGLILGLYLHNPTQPSDPTPPAATAVKSDEEVATARSDISPRDYVEAAHTSYVRFILNNRARLERLEQTPEGQKLVARLREDSRRVEEAYQKFLKQEAESQRLRASLAQLQQSIHRQTNPGQTNR